MPFGLFHRVVLLVADAVGSGDAVCQVAKVHEWNCPSVKNFCRR